MKPRALTLLGRGGDLIARFFPGERPAAEVFEELRSLANLPLRGTRPRREKTPPWLPTDGIIYWESPLDVVHQGLQSNLKWHRGDAGKQAFQAYVRQLCRCIAAEAVVEGARVERIYTAYPSVFPRHLYGDHRQLWDMVAREIGAEASAPITESEALAAHYVQRGTGNKQVSLVAIDIGGSTADLAAWIDGERRVYDSVRMAGDILSRLVATDAAARAEVRRAALATLHERETFDWHPARSDTHGLFLTALLHAVARESKDGGTRALAHALYRGPDSPGARIIAHAGYLYAAVSYLAGLAVRRAAPRRSSYDVFFAGRGSQFLPWLDCLADDASRQLPRAFFLAGLGVARGKVEITVKPPGHYAKEEVGRGLLAEESRQESRRLSTDENGAAGDRERSTLLGETGFSDVDGKPIPWDRTVKASDLARMVNPSDRLRPESLEMLAGFVRVFREDESARAVARALGMVGDPVNGALVRRIVQRLFGAGSARQAALDAERWKQASIGVEKDERDTGVKDEPPEPDFGLLEPFFIVEAKTLLEAVSNNLQLFTD